MLHHAKTAIAGAQILFVAFGAMVLIPLLTGLNPALALLGAGVGTLLFQLLTKRKVPIFLGSSHTYYTTENAPFRAIHPKAWCAARRAFTAK